jgi:peptidoglycan biosynthesis protein MviN/MurJ (putative lipid II flippase)
MYFGVVGVLYAFLQAILPLRRTIIEDPGGGLFPEAVTRVRSWGIALGCAAGAVLFVSSGTLTRTVLHIDGDEAAHWLMLFAASLPFFLLTRAVAFEAIASRSYWQATSIVAVPGITGVVLLLVLIPVWGAAGAAITSLAQEVVGSAVIVVRRLVRRHRAANVRNIEHLEGRTPGGP